jgi:Transposase
VSSGFSTKYVEEKIGIPQQTVARIRKTAFQRGFRPDEDPRILEHYVEDAKRSGRPKTITEAIEETVLASVREDRSGREKSSEYLGYEVNISRSSVLRILKRHGLTCVKATRKPILTPKMREARLRFARAHGHWTSENWKQVIRTDETSVVLGHRRGAVRLWRDSKEAYDPTCIRRRWKGFSEFMFWGSFTWYEKGPTHIWKPVSVAKASEMGPRPPIRLAPESCCGLRATLPS